MAGFSIRATITGVGSAPPQVRRWTFAASLLSQLPGLLVTSGVAIGGHLVPAWASTLAVAATIGLTPLAPFAATALWRSIDAGTALPLSSLAARYVRRAGAAAVMLASLLMVVGWLFSGHLLWTGAPGGAEAAAQVVLGALALAGLARSCLWFNVLARTELSPFVALPESWRLTRAWGLKLMGYWVGFFLLCLLLSLPVAMFINALAARAGVASDTLFPASSRSYPEWLMVIIPAVSILLNAAIAGLAALSLAVMDRQLSDDTEPRK